MDWTPPNDWWCVNTPREMFRLDAVEAGRVLLAWNTGDRMVSFVDIYGSRTTIRMADVESVWECSSEVRARARAMGRMLDEESGPEWQPA